jgi:hypothetical protein
VLSWLVRISMFMSCCVTPDSCTLELARGAAVLLLGCPPSVAVGIAVCSAGALNIEWAIWLAPIGVAWVVGVWDVRHRALEPSLNVGSSMVGASWRLPCSDGQALGGNKKTTKKRHPKKKPRERVRRVQSDGRTPMQCRLCLCDPSKRCLLVSR